MTRPGEDASLKHHRYSVASHPPLPDEILLEIFVCRRQDAIRFGQYSSWIPEVAHVCRCWRTIALSVGTLWAMPDFSRPRVASNMLAWSGVSPLSIRFWWDAGRARDANIRALNFVLSTIRRACPRMRCLHLAIPSRHVPELITSASQAAPLLQSLRLSLHDGANSTSGRGLFSGVTPHLRELSLRSGGVELIRPSAPLVQRLSIWRANIPSVVYLHSLLRSMPCLQELTTCGSLTRAVLPPADHQPSAVHLPSLHTLYIHETPRALEALLPALRCSFLSLGHSKRLHIGSVHAHNTDIVLPWLSVSLATPLTGLSLHLVYCTLDGFTCDQTLDWYSLHSSPLMMAFDALRGIIPPLLHAALHAFSFVHVTCLAVHGDEQRSLPRSTWRALYTHLPNVATLHLQDRCEVEALAVLYEEHDMLSALRKLVIHDAIWLYVPQMEQILQRRLPEDDPDPMAWMVFWRCGLTAVPLELIRALARDPRLRATWDGVTIAAV